MLKQDYSEYSGYSIEELDAKINQCDDLILQDLLVTTNSNKYLDLLSRSTSITYGCFRLGFNIDKMIMMSKFALFSPQMIPLITDSSYKNALEHLGGLGILSDLLKEISPSTEVTYSNINSDLLRFVEWRKNKYNLDINLLTLDDSCLIKDNYDLIISYGNLQYFNQDQQIEIIKNMVNKTNKDGLLTLLVDLSGPSSSPLYYDVDINNIHSILEHSDMNCIYGKNTFSSLWKKMI